MSDNLLAIDNGDRSSLVLFDLSSAFDTVDHHILLQRLEMIFGVGDVALSWFTMQLLGRKTTARRRSSYGCPPVVEPARYHNNHFESELTLVAPVSVV